MPRGLTDDSHLTILKRLRLALGGAALGVAIIGVVGPLVGLRISAYSDLIAAAAGAIVAAITVEVSFTGGKLHFRR